MDPVLGVEPRCHRRELQKLLQYHYATPELSIFVVDLTGIEPATSALQRQRSPN